MTNRDGSELALKLDLEAVLLVGGRGTRLRSAVPDRPKPLADIDGRPFVQLLLDRLAAAGIRRVVLCTGHLGEMISSAFGERFGAMDLVYSRESTPLGTGGALRSALPLLRAATVLVMNGDSYCDVDLAAFLAAHRSSGAGATLLVVEHQPEAERYGSVEVEGSRVRAFTEKGRSGKGLISAGMYLIERSSILDIPSGGPVSIERDVFPRWVDKGLCAFLTTGTFIDIGTPRSYTAARSLLAHVRS